MYILIYIFYFIERRTTCVRYIIKVARDRSTMLPYLVFYYRRITMGKCCTSADLSRARLYAKIKTGQLSFPEGACVPRHIIAERLDVLARFVSSNVFHAKLNSSDKGRRLRVQRQAEEKPEEASL